MDKPLSQLIHNTKNLSIHSTKVENIRYGSRGFGRNEERMKEMGVAHSIQGFSSERAENDFYPTPPNATEALLRVEDFIGVIWEPACGDGAISKVLKQTHEVISTDLVYRGYGEGNSDFLLSYREVDNIITNPPYGLATEFVDHALRCANRKVAMLLKIQFLEGKKRYELFKNSPLKKVHVFSQRLKIYKNGVNTNGSSMMCFAWFVWEKGFEGEPTINWLI